MHAVSKRKKGWPTPRSHPLESATAASCHSLRHNLSIASIRHRFVDIHYCESRCLRLFEM